jgi:hypothetical protein
VEGWTHRPCPHGKSTTAARVDATSQLLEIEIVDMEAVSEPAASAQNKRKHDTAFVAEPAASGQKKRKHDTAFVAEAAASGQNKRKHDTAFVAEAAASGQNTTRSLTRARTVDINEADAMIAACRMKPIDASHFLDNTLLPTLIAEHSANFKTLTGTGGCVPLGREHVHASSVGELTWGSLCSGSEGAHFVMEHLNEHFGTLGPGFSTNLKALHLRQVFACEISPQKRRWIDALVNSQRRADDRPLMCIFCDIRDMGKTAMCIIAFVLYRIAISWLQVHRARI